MVEVIGTELLTKSLKTDLFLLFIYKFNKCVDFEITRFYWLFNVPQSSEVFYFLDQ